LQENSEMKSSLAAGALAGCVGVAAVAASITTPGTKAPIMEAASQSPVATTAPTTAEVIAGVAPMLFDFADEPIAIERDGVCMIFAPGTSPEYMDYAMKRWGQLPEALRFEANDRWFGFANNDPVSLTYSFPPDGTNLSGQGGSGNVNIMNAQFDAVYGNALWKSLFRQSFDAWENVSGNVYTEVSDDGAAWPFTGVSAARGHIRIVGEVLDGAGGVLAFNYFPDTGDMFMDTGDLTGSNFGNPNNNYRFLRNVIIHENGHGMGLSHSCPVTGSKLMEPFINTSFDGPQVDDVLGMQILYGDTFEPNNNTATAATPAESGILPDTTKVNTRLSIDASGDADLFRVAVTGASTLAVSVTPQTGTYFAGPQLGSGCPTPGGGWPSVNVGDNANLRIEILDSGGSQIGLQDVNGAGQGESIGSFSLPASGDYFIRITGSSWTDIQLYNLTATLTGGGCPGDLNGNGSVNGSDLGILLGAWGAASNFPPADLNGDGSIDGADLGLLLGCWTS
jgi:hypothetical protein